MVKDNKLFQNPGLMAVAIVGVVGIVAVVALMSGSPGTSSPVSMPLVDSTTQNIAGKGYYGGEDLGGDNEGDDPDLGQLGKDLFLGVGKTDFIGCYHRSDGAVGCQHRIDWTSNAPWFSDDLEQFSGCLILMYQAGEDINGCQYMGRQTTPAGYGLHVVECPGGNTYNYNDAGTLCEAVQHYGW